MKSIILALAALSTISAAPVPAGVEQARKVLRKCGTTEAQLARQPDQTWATRTGALADHAALRTALHEAMPQGASLVLLYGAGGHLETTQYSIALQRLEDGRWQGSAVGRSHIWIKDAPFTPLPKKQWVLAPAKAGRLDAILADRCLYAEPTTFDDGSTPSLAAMVVRLDVQTPARHRSAHFLGDRAKGLTAENVQLATPE